MLKRLAVLSVIYYDKVVRGEDGKWESLLSADFCFLDRISIQSPRALAELITSEDEDCFRKFSIELSDSKDFVLRWAKLADNVKACCTIDRNLINPIGESVKVRFSLSMCLSTQLTLLTWNCDSIFCVYETITLQRLCLLAFPMLVVDLNRFLYSGVLWIQPITMRFIGCNGPRLLDYHFYSVTYMETG